MKSKSELIEIYKKLLKGDFQGWVLFSHGTCVVIPHINKTIENDAIEVLQKYGKIIPGTPSGDFNVVPLKDNLGWVITGDHPDILNHVSSDEAREDRSDPGIGLIGRNKRGLDAKELKIIHTEEIDKSEPTSKVD